MDNDDLFAATAPRTASLPTSERSTRWPRPKRFAAGSTSSANSRESLVASRRGIFLRQWIFHGPPGAGKTVTTRRVCREFAARHDDVAVEYVNLKECRTIFSAANEIHLEVTGEKVGAYEGLDGAFDGIWTALEEHPKWTVHILDEIDHLTQDTNYDPSEFLYRLLRGEGRLAREIQLSAWLISNELLAVDLRLDSRVESARSEETVFFGPYGQDALATLLWPRLQDAFHYEAFP